MPIAPLLALLVLLLSAARVGADERPAPRLLPVPLALGGTPGFFGPSPGTADLAAHLRGTVLFGTEQPGAPALSLRWGLGASVSLWRWAEAGARFSGRWDLETRQHAPGPVELWLRAGPPERSVLGGAALQAVIEHAAGRGGFDEGGRLWTSTTNFGAAAAMQRWRLRFAGSLTYERAEADGAPAAYHGLRAGVGAWFAAAKPGEHLGLDVGGDALVRVGGTEGPRGPLDVAAVFAVGVRLIDENGAAFRAGYGQGYGPGMPARFGLAGIGWSYGRGYVHQRSTSALLDQLSDWLRDQWAQRTAPGFGARWLPPPPSLLAPPPRPPTDVAGALRPRQPPHCDALQHLPPGGDALALRSCTELWDLGRHSTPTAGPPAPQEPYGPPLPPGALAGGPPRAQRPPGGVPGRSSRTGRGGTGYTDPDTRAPAPGDLPATVWTGGRPGGPTMVPADAPTPPPSIPIRPQPPGPLPPGMRPGDVPTFLRPAPAGTAPRPANPVAPGPTTPPSPVEPAPSEAPSAAAHAPPAPVQIVPPRRRGSNIPEVAASAQAGTWNHQDQPQRLPDQLRAQYPETTFTFHTRPGEAGQDVRVVGGKHPSAYPASTWPAGVNHADFKPDTPGGRRTFARDQRTKWPEPTHMLPYDPVTGRLR